MFSFAGTVYICVVFALFAAAHEQRQIEGNCTALGEAIFEGFQRFGESFDQFLPNMLDAVVHPITSIDMTDKHMVIEVVCRVFGSDSEDAVLYLDEAGILTAVVRSAYEMSICLLNEEMKRIPYEIEYYSDWMDRETVLRYTMYSIAGRMGFLDLSPAGVCDMKSLLRILLQPHYFSDYYDAPNFKPYLDPDQGADSKEEMCEDFHNATAQIVAFNPMIYLTLDMAEVNLSNVRYSGYFLCRIIGSDSIQDLTGFLVDSVFFTNLFEFGLNQISILKYELERALYIANAPPEVNIMPSWEFEHLWPNSFVYKTAMEGLAIMLQGLQDYGLIPMK